MGVQRQLQVHAAALHDHAARRLQPDVEGDRRPPGGLGLQLGLGGLRHVALDHVDGGDARTQAGLGVDLRAVQPEVAVDLHLAVRGARDGYPARGGRLGGVVVDQAEALEVELEAGAPAALQADDPRPRDLAGLLVLGGEGLQLDHVALQVRVEREVGEHQPGGEVLELAAGHGRVAGQQRIGQGAGDGPLQLHLARQLPLGAIDQIPQRLHLALGREAAGDRLVAHDGELQGRRRGHHREFHRRAGAHAPAAGRLGVDVEPVAAQHRLDRRIHRHGLGRIDAAGVVELGGHRAGEPGAGPLQVDVRVDVADEVRAERLEIDAAHRAHRAGCALGLLQVEVETAVAHGQPQARGEVLAVAPDGDRLHRAELDQAELARAGQSHLLGRARLLVDAVDVQGQRALRRLGVGGELERQAAERARPRQLAGADHQRGIPQRRIDRLQRDGGRGRPAIGDPDGP